MCESFSIAKHCLDEPIFGEVTVSVFEDYINIFVSMMLTMPTGFLGLVGNTLCVIVFAKSCFLPPTTQRLLLVFSSVNLLHLSTTFLVIMSGVFCSENCHLWYIFRSHLYFGMTMTAMSWFELIRTWIVVVIGFERYLVTCRTMEFHTRWTVRIVNILHTIIVIGSLVSRAPMIANFVLDSMPPEMCRVALRMSTVNSLVYAFGMSLFPLFSLTFCTVVVLKAHKRHLKVSSVSSKTTKVGYRAHKAIMTLLCGMNCLCVAYLFDGVFSLVWDNMFHHESSCVFHVVHRFFYIFAISGSVMMSSMGFFVFVTLWKKFRAELKDTLRETRRRICCR